MWALIVSALAALYLMWIPMALTTQNYRSAFLFQYVPLLLGIALAFSAVARFFGWPI